MVAEERKKKCIYTKYIIQEIDAFHTKARAGLGLISLLIEDLHSIHTNIYKIQLVRYFCCFGYRSKGSGKEVLLKNL